MYIIIPISILLIFNIVIILISFIKTFYSVNKQKKTNDIILPNHNIYKIYKNEIIEDIKEVRKIIYKELFIKSHDGLNLYGRYFEYKKGNPIEIMFHGYRGNSENDLSTGVLRAFKCKRNVIY